MVIGNFNEILFAHEKMGGKQRNETLMNIFRFSMEASELHDLGHKGDIFTWCNRHTAKTFTKVLHDRALANVPWSQLYTKVWIETLVSRCSDQRPILATCSRPSFERHKHRRLFHYEVSLDLKEDCSTKVDLFWNRGRANSDPPIRFQQRLQNCEEGLKRW